MHTKFSSMDGRCLITYYFDFRFRGNYFKLNKISKLLSLKTKKTKNKKQKTKKNKTKIKTKQNFYQQIQDFAHH